MADDVREEDEWLYGESDNNVKREQPVSQEYEEEFEASQPGADSFGGKDGRDGGGGEEGDDSDATGVARQPLGGADHVRT